MSQQDEGRPPRRPRMTGAARREQLVSVGRGLFAAKGVDGTSVEEIAGAAEVSKPVVYEHFGGKEGLYAVVVDRELSVLTEAVTTALTAGGTDRQIIERAALALLDYIEGSPDGFRILARDVSGEAPSGTYSSLISDVATQVAHLLSEPFEQRGFDPTTAPMYAQMLVGLVSLTGQWWLETRQPDKESVAAHLVNLAWNGLDGLEPHPTLHGRN
ncbi:TetR/AcrR family transcriptional regulator [Janibacter hoylei PVAS-1]|uniref:TetR/AcrR family transcriptional regulator n=2 Tax=Janibacter hoylei PVAS-1 TaxID=1210046 RepID=A0A444B8P4_9MICO|nr:TetR/AcrR family transcriptional regulator [Janibacter hoylei]RWU84785.1 TetR/AcrR family transcriptional regulator [Janibacter hoylei PVAS-1]